jgi:hypothetical protein
MTTYRVSFDVLIPDGATLEQVLEGVKWRLGETSTIDGANPLAWNDYQLQAISGTTAISFVVKEDV